MGKFRIEITHVAEKDFAKHFKSGNKSNINTIQKILIELENSPYEGIGKPEKLNIDLVIYGLEELIKKID